MTIRQVGRKDGTKAYISFVLFPSEEVFYKIYKELSDESKRELVRLMKEGKVRIIS